MEGVSQEQDKDSILQNFVLSSYPILNIKLECFVTYDKIVSFMKWSYLITR